MSFQTIRTNLSGIQVAGFSESVKVVQPEVISPKEQDTIGEFKEGLEKVGNFVVATTRMSRLLLEEKVGNHLPPVDEPIELWQGEIPESVSDETMMKEGLFPRAKERYLPRIRIMFNVNTGNLIYNTRC